jgi:predicted ATPase/class 3 adenylate cyclase
MAILCAHCGFNNPPGMRFCGNCGTRLADSPAPPAAKSSPAELIPEQLGITMGAGLLERFHQAGLEAAGQRRNVTVLFTDLSGYTELAGDLDNEDVFDIIQQYIQILINEVYKYEGIVDKLTGDGLMALFGAPIAHENNAERAVRAALDMQTSISQWSQQIKESMDIQLQMRVGLHAGSVIVGGIGSNMLMDYTAIGDTVNLAHRIEEAALPGTILVSEAVYRQTRMIFNFDVMPNLTLKGIPKAVTGYRVTSAKKTPGPMRGLEGLRAPMIGRDGELDRLKQEVTTLSSQKQGKFALITGEAGIGKSRLTAELKALVGRTPVRILEGFSLTYRRSVSYWIFLDMLRGYLKVTASTSEAEISRRLTQSAYQVLGQRAADILPYLEHLLSIKPSNPTAAERIRFLEAGQLRQQIFRAVRDLLVAEARRRPLMLILEDLHWADEASLDLLIFLLDSIRRTPIFVYAISRPFQEGPLARIGEWASKHLGEQFIPIQLRSLSPDQSDDLLNKLLSIPNLPEELRKQILQRAAGVPFYLEEILRTLIDKGVIQRENGHWRILEEVESSSLGVPDTLEGLILARFDRLEEFPRRALQIASVIGHQFSQALLNTMLQPASETRVQEALNQLVEREYILPQSETTNGEYIFRHVLMSEAIYNTILKRERSKLHGQVGEAIEALYAGRLEEHIELLARHYSWSPRLDRALHYLILAGQKAAASYVNEQARQNFEGALALLEQVEATPEQILQVYMGLGDVLVLVGEYSDARSHYQAALEDIGSFPESFNVESSTLQRKIGTTYERQGEYDDALLHLRQALDTLESVNASAPVEKARIYNELGWIQFRRGNLDTAKEHLINALSFVESSSQYDVTASIYNRLGGVYYQMDQLDLASNYVRKSLVLREEIGDIAAVARSYNNLGLLGWRRGDWDSALENLKHSVDLHATLGDVEGMIELHSNMGLLLLDRGNIQDALEHFNEALASAQQIGHSYHIGLMYLNLSRLYISTEDWTTALEYSQRSLDIFKEIGVLDHLVDVYTYTGLAWLGQGNLLQAKKWGEEALGMFRQLGTGKLASQAEDRGRALRLVGDIACIEGRYKEAETLLIESSAIFQAIGNQLEQGRSTISLAALAAARQDFTLGRMLLNEARLIFKQLGAKNDVRKVEAMAAQLIPQ